MQHIAILSRNTEIGGVDLWSKSIPDACAVIYGTAFAEELQSKLRGQKTFNFCK